VKEKIREPEDPLDEVKIVERVVVHAMYGNELDRLITMQADRINELEKFLTSILFMIDPDASSNGYAVAMRIVNHKKDNDK